ncbi:glycosyltransferase family 4 protein [Flagellimonas sp. GZD32]|uniref:glycosyltransferase family 4 protein n=1 Tax=Flagellimonas cixiensis TaxID=3228750 RepID=UPI0035C8F1D3
MDKKKILIVGQTPPPYHGQAIMIQNTLNHEYENLEIYHVRMEFSKEMQEVGKFGFYKVFQLIKLIFKIIYNRFRYNINNLYYPPAGPDNVAIIRDLMILSCVRWMFSSTIYHFRAGGISQKVDTYPSLLKAIVKFILGKPDLTIRLSSRNPRDGEYFKTLRDVVVPNGIKDFSKNYSLEGRKGSTILFVGALKKTKGVMDILTAVKLMKQSTEDFQMHFMGKFDDSEFEEQCKEFIQSEQLHMVRFLGVKTDAAKWDEFALSDIFCFPSFYESETFGNVLLEAMQFKIPVVATFWRGIPDIVVDGETGYLVPINRPDLICEKLLALLHNYEVRLRMGEKGKKRYLETFTENLYYKNFEKEVYRACK